MSTDHRGAGVFAQQRGDTFLIVDPLDGTKEFINGAAISPSTSHTSKTACRRAAWSMPRPQRMFLTLADGRRG